MPLKARLKTVRYRIDTATVSSETQTHLRHKKDQSHSRICGRIKASIIRVDHAGPCTYQPVWIGIDSASVSSRPVRRLWARPEDATYLRTQALTGTPACMNIRTWPASAMSPHVADRVERYGVTGDRSLPPA